jgi:hypothetical protein
MVSSLMKEFQVMVPMVEITPRSARVEIRYLNILHRYTKEIYLVVSCDLHSLSFPQVVHSPVGWLSETRADPTIYEGDS